MCKQSRYAGGAGARVRALGEQRGVPTGGGWGLDCARRGMWAEHTRHAVPGMEELGWGCVCGEGRPTSPVCAFSLAFFGSWEQSFFPVHLIQLGLFINFLYNIKESLFHSRMCD